MGPLQSMEAENGHGFFFFYALLSCDNNLSRYLNITRLFSRDYEIMCSP